MYLEMGSFLPTDHSFQVVRLETLRGLWQIDQEIVQRLLVFVLPTQVVLKVRVDLVALVDEGLVVGEHDEEFFADFV